MDKKERDPAYTAAVSRLYATFPAGQLRAQGQTQINTCEQGKKSRASGLGRTRKWCSYTPRTPPRNPHTFFLPDLSARFQSLAFRGRVTTLFLLFEVWYLSCPSPEQVSLASSLARFSSGPSPEIKLPPSRGARARQNNPPP